MRYPGERRRHLFHDETGDIQTDDFGYFTLPYVARGKTFVVESATAERLPGSTKPLMLEEVEAAGVEVTAGRIGQVLRGTVTDSAGNPRSGVMVRLRPLPGPKITRTERVSRLYMQLLNQRTVTGSEGSYEFKGLPPGRVVLIAGVQGGPLTKHEQMLPASAFPGDVHVIDLIVD